MTSVGELCGGGLRARRGDQRQLAAAGPIVLGRVRRRGLPTVAGNRDRGGGDLREPEAFDGTTGGYDNVADQLWRQIGSSWHRPIRRRRSDRAHRRPATADVPRRVPHPEGPVRHQPGYWVRRRSSAELQDLTWVDGGGVGEDSGVGLVQGLPATAHPVRGGDLEQGVTGDDRVRPAGCRRGRGHRHRLRAGGRWLRAGGGVAGRDVTEGRALPTTGVCAGPRRPTLPGQGLLGHRDLLFPAGSHWTVRCRIRRR